jgi:hypothetical protein
MIYYQLIFSCLIILNQTQINIIKKKLYSSTYQQFNETCNSW